MEKQIVRVRTCTNITTPSYYLGEPWRLRLPEWVQYRVSPGPHGKGFIYCISFYDVEERDIYLQRLNKLAKILRDIRFKNRMGLTESMLRHELKTRFIPQADQFVSWYGEEMVPYHARWEIDNVRKHLNMKSVPWPERHIVREIKPDG